MNEDLWLNVVRTSLEILSLGNISELYTKRNIHEVISVPPTLYFLYLSVLRTAWIIANTSTGGREVFIQESHIILVNFWLYRQLVCPSSGSIHFGVHRLHRLRSVKSSLYTLTPFTVREMRQPTSQREFPIAAP